LFSLLRPTAPFSDHRLCFSCFPRTSAFFFRTSACVFRFCFRASAFFFSGIRLCFSFFLRTSAFFVRTSACAFRFVSPDLRVFCSDIRVCFFFFPGIRLCFFLSCVFFSFRASACVFRFVVGHPRFFVRTSACVFRFCSEPPCFLLFLGHPRFVFFGHPLVFFVVVRVLRWCFGSDAGAVFLSQTKQKSQARVTRRTASLLREPSGKTATTDPRLRHRDSDCGTATSTAAP
jgi:hypothetical protein